MKRFINGIVQTNRIPFKPIAALVLVFLLTGMAISTSSTLEKQAESAPIRTLAASTMPNTPSDTLVQLTQRLSPSVVNIKVTRVNNAAGWRLPETDEHPFGDLFRRFFNQERQFPGGSLTRAAGSGVIISKDGHILTNHHVIEGAQEVVVTLFDQKEYVAEITGSDPKTDLAVLTISRQDAFPAAQMGDSDRLSVGEWVIAIGNPFGLGHTVTTGIVSGKGRVIGAGPYDDFIQTDASINPGNSGGPLFNMRGELIGINTAIIPQGQGIGFAIPVNTAKPLIPQLVARGKVTRGFLGVNIQSLSPALSNALHLDNQHGALVADVASGSPADQAGIQVGDIIVSYDGKAFEDARQLPALVANTPVGQVVTLTVIRQRLSQDIELTVGQLPSRQIEQAATRRPDKAQWGLHLSNWPQQMVNRRSPAGQVVVVVGVTSDSPAEAAGMRRGDIILQVNQQPVSSVEDVKNVLQEVEPDEALLLLLQRRDTKRFVALAK